MSTESQLVKRHIVVTTDYALGDDHGAVLALCAYAALHRDTQVSFVGTYGNRSTLKAAGNLASELPRLWKHLGQDEKSCPHVYVGADRPFRKKGGPYKEGEVERTIHGDFPHEPGIFPLETKDSDVLYEELKKSQIPVALLSLGAPTEAVKATKKLQSQIRESVAMLGAGSVQGNTGPHREANATHDPEKNRELLEISEKFAVPLTLVRLDCTEQAPVLIDEMTLHSLEKELGAQSFAMQELNSIASKQSTYGGFYLGRPYVEASFPFGNKQYHGVPLHDLTAAMALIDLLSEEDQKMFRYAKQVPISFLKDGSEGEGRDYFEYPPTNVDLVGPVVRSYKDVLFSTFGTRLKEKYWQEIIKLLKLYK